MRTWRWYSKALFALLVAAFAYFVWPTPWRYFTARTDMPEIGTSWREHRVTGRLQLFAPLVSSAEHRPWVDVYSPHAKEK